MDGQKLNTADSKTITITCPGFIIIIFIIIIIIWGSFQTQNPGTKESLAPQEKKSYNAVASEYGNDPTISFPKGNTVFKLGKVNIQRFLRTVDTRLNLALLHRKGNFFMVSQ